MMAASVGGPKPDWFLGGMIAATVLAWAVPGPGAGGGRFIRSC